MILRCDAVGLSCMHWECKHLECMHSTIHPLCLSCPPRMFQLLHGLWNPGNQSNQQASAQHSCLPWAKCMGNVHHAA